MLIVNTLRAALKAVLADFKQELWEQRLCVQAPGFKLLADIHKSKSGLTFCYEQSQQGGESDYNNTSNIHLHHIQLVLARQKPPMWCCSLMPWELITCNKDSAQLLGTTTTTRIIIACLHARETQYTASPY